jgi:Ca2+-binding RTX toxin-like protein
MANIFGKNPMGETIDASDGVTNGADVIIGNAGKDHIYGLGGNDMLKGGGGADILDGGAGTDTAYYDDSGVGVQVSLQLGKGAGGTAEGDTLISIENLYGSNHDDFLEGDAGDNTIEGGDGNDTIKGGGGSDKLFGGNGNDILVGDGPNMKYDGGDGIDTVDFSGSGFSKFINLEIGLIGPYHPHNQQAWTPAIVNVENVIGSNLPDNLVGDANDNQLIGGGGADTLLGRGGNDKLDGGAGDDTINGGAGADSLTGGTGSDTFVFIWADESVVTNGAIQDVIQDFETGLDKIDLHNLNFQLADMLTLNGTVGNAHYSDIGVDTNHNGMFDNGEFAIHVKMAGNGYLSSGDLVW